jgi:hypothetical protein
MMANNREDNHVWDDGALHNQELSETYNMLTPSHTQFIYFFLSQITHHI